MKPIVSGFPRCGNNWVLYIVSSLLGAKNPKSPESRREVVLRNHIFSPSNRKTFFLLRNHKECLIRHYTIEVYKKYKSPTAFLNSQEINSGYKIVDFIQNLQKYDKTNKENILLINYEDLITNPNEIINNIGHHINVKQNNINEFLENIEYHKQNSLSAKPPEKSFTKGNSTLYHSLKLSKQERLEFDSFYRNKYPEIFSKYLQRYAE